MAVSLINQPPRIGPDQPPGPARTSRDIGGSGRDQPASGTLDRMDWERALNIINRSAGEGPVPSIAGVPDINMSSINQIQMVAAFLDESDLTAEARDTIVQEAGRSLQLVLAVQGGIMDLNLVDILDWTGEDLTTNPDFETVVPEGAPEGAL